jgi:hypothetical protein
MAASPSIFTAPFSMDFGSAEPSAGLTFGWKSEGPFGRVRRE